MSRHSTFIGGGAALLAFAAMLQVNDVAAQAPAGAAAGGPRFKVVEVQPQGGPPTGPHAVVIEHDQSFATHTIYRPATLGDTKHPTLVWGEGGCAKNGLMFPEFLARATPLAAMLSSRCSLVRLVPCALVSPISRFARRFVGSAIRGNSYKPPQMTD